MLSTDQLIMLKTDIDSIPEFVDIHNNSNNAEIIADYYNKLTDDYYVWKTKLTIDEIEVAVNWSEMLTSSTQKELIVWQTILMKGYINPSLPNVRLAIASIFSGPSFNQTRQNLLNISVRLATRAEKLLSLGNGTIESPSTMTIEGDLKADSDIIKARSL